MNYFNFKETQNMRVHQIKNAIIQCNFNVDELFHFGEFIARQIEERFKNREGLGYGQGWKNNFGRDDRNRKKNKGTQYPEEGCRLRLSGVGLRKNPKGKRRRLKAV